MSVQSFFLLLIFNSIIPSIFLSSLIHSFILSLLFDDLFKLNALTFMHKYHYGKLPSSFDNKFTPLMNLNRTQSYKLNLAANKNLEGFPSYFLPKIWNSISLELKNIPSLKLFNKSIKSKDLAAYANFTCSRENCYSCKDIY